MEKLDWEIFTGLINNLKCETESETDVIGFQAKYKGYELSFQGFEEDDFGVMVWECGRMLKGKWIQMEVDKQQREVMKIHLQSRKTEISIETIEELQRESNNAARELELKRYGQEGAIYSSDY